MARLYAFGHRTMPISTKIRAERELRFASHAVRIYTKAVKTYSPSARLTRGMTSIAISSIERFARVGSAQSWPT